MIRSLHRLLAEMRRRRVLRTLSIYTASAWLLISVADVALPFLNAPEWVLGVVIWGALLGLPFTGIVAWFYALVPEAGVKHERTDTDTQKPPWDVLLIAVLLSALTVSIYLNVAPGASNPIRIIAPPTSLAVLPFADMSSSQDQAYFGDGLAEELLNQLTKNPVLHVAARTSSFRFRDRSASIAEIAQQLQVAYVLEGSVRREADRLRVTAQLISAQDGYHVWSETYDETFDNVFSIQDRISAQIAAAMETTVLAGHAAPRTDGNGYLMYLQASQLAREGSREALEGAADLFKQVLAIDPAYAPAWARLANVYSNLAGQGHVDYTIGFDLAADAAQQAIDADPEYAGGYIQQSWLAHRYEGDLAAAASAMQAALDLEPRNVSVLRSAAVLLLQLGQLDEAIEVLTYCAKRSPLDPRGFHNLGIAQKYADRLQDAQASFERTLFLSPDYHGAKYQLAEVLLLLDRPTEASTYFADLDGYRPLFGQALTEYALGNASASDAALKQLETDWGEQWPGTLADVHAFRGELDAAFEWLEKDYQKFGAAGWGELKLQRLLDNLKQDPRWTDLLERAGATDEQLAAHKLKVVIR